MASTTSTPMPPPTPAANIWLMPPPPKPTAATDKAHPAPVPQTVLPPVVFMQTNTITTTTAPPCHIPPPPPPRPTPTHRPLLNPNPNACYQRHTPPSNWPVAHARPAPYPPRQQQQQQQGILTLSSWTLIDLSHGLPADWAWGTYLTAVTFPRMPQLQLLASRWFNEEPYAHGVLRLNSKGRWLYFYDSPSEGAFYLLGTNPGHVAAGLKRLARDWEHRKTMRGVRREVALARVVGEVVGRKERGGERDREGAVGYHA